MTRQLKSFRRRITLGAIALAAGVVACSDKGQQLLGDAVPTSPAEAQTSPAKVAKGPAKPLPPGVYELQVAEIMDTEHFGRPFVAARALIPTGWHTEGGAVWNKGDEDCGDVATFEWAAVSPDGNYRIEVFPTELWSATNFSNQQKCQYGTAGDVRTYLGGVVQNNIPGARVTNYRPRPDFLEPNREYNDAKVNGINASGTGQTAWTDAGEVTYSARLNNVDVDGVLAVSAMFYGINMPNGGDGPPLMSIVGLTQSTFAASAPKGKLDPVLAEMVRKSFKLAPPWASEYLNISQAISDRQYKANKVRASINIANGAALTAATIARNQAAVNSAIANTYADPVSASSSTDDRIQRERIESIRGVETYDDPVYGGTVQLDNTYDHAWRVQNNDSYILTNDPNFNPGAYNIDASQLKVTR